MSDPLPAAPETDRQRPLLLVIEDDLTLQAQIRWSFDGFRLLFAHDHASAITQIKRHNPPVITLDLGLPPKQRTPEEGFNLLSSIAAIAPDAKVIAVTGQDERANAIKAIGLGAYDFIAKPFQPEVLGVVLNRAFRIKELEDEARRDEQSGTREPLPGLVTRDTAMMRLCRQVEKLAPLNATVLLQGETGTGKESFARSLHRLSSRNTCRMVSVNCAAPEAELESQLFGIRRGFAVKNEPEPSCLIEQAHGGTLLLDEIGSLPMNLQAHLLHFLESRALERTGGMPRIDIDVRVVATSRIDLKSLIDQGQFREDLFYRLSEFDLRIPPLRERVGDAVLLARAFTDRFASLHSRRRMKLTDAAIIAIENYAWPGNVRELENRIKRAVIMGENSAISTTDIELGAADADETFNLKELREGLEKRTVLRALARASGSITKTADLLGVTRPTLYDLLSRLGLR